MATAAVTWTKAELKERSLARIIAGSGLSDVRETDPMVQEVDAFATDLERAHIEQWEIRDEGMPSQCSDEAMDGHLAEVLPDGMARDEGDYAIGGAVKFYRPNASATILNIAAGTNVYRSKDGFAYKTMTLVTIGAGATESNATSVIALRKGSLGNCAVEEIDRIGTPISGVTVCLNSAGIDNGADRQSRDDAYTTMRDYVRGISPATKPGILYRLKQIEDPTYGKVRFAKFGSVSPLTPGMISVYIDNGLGTAGPLTAVSAGEILLSSAVGGETSLYLDNWPINVVPTLYKNTVAMSPQPVWAYPTGQAQLTSGLTAMDAITAGAYSVFGGLVAIAQKVVDGSVADPTTYPGNSGAGDIVRVLPAALYGAAQTTIGFKFWPRTGVDKESLKAAIKRIVTQYVNSLDIGQRLFASDIIRLVRSVDLVDDVTEVTFNGASVNSINPSESQVIRTSDALVVPV
jgi:hypothetical protein